MAKETKESTQILPDARILILNDNQDEADAVRQFLEVNGTEVIHADSWEGAREALEGSKADLLLVDSHSSAAGPDLLTQLEEAEIPAGIPVVLLADSEDESEGGAALESGRVDVITRPIDRAEIMCHVGALLRLKDRNDQLREENAELEEKNQELLARNRDLEMGMEMAHRLQDALLPQKYPHVKNVSFCHKYTPADAIGGDFFHIDNVGEDKAVLFVFDVSGHGVRAALVTSAIKTLIDHVDLESKGPGDILSEINTRFRDFLGAMAPQIFATSFVMVVDGGNYDVSIASAGHPSPLLIRKADMTVQPVMDQDKGGPALGFLDEMQYGSEGMDLQEGDMILGFTDGVYEVRDEEGEYYGVWLMYELMEENVRLVPRDVIQKILAETEEFKSTHWRMDDICLVSAEIH